MLVVVGVVIVVIGCLVVEVVTTCGLGSDIGVVGVVGVVGMGVVAVDVGVPVGDVAGVNNVDDDDRQLLLLLLLVLLLLSMSESVNHSLCAMSSMVGRFVHSNVNIDLTSAFTAGAILLFRTQ